jgi:hypothetical protein
MSMMQEIRVKPESADLFTMTVGDIARMRAIARHQVRISTTKLESTPKADVEAAMIRGMTGDAKRTGRKDLLKWNEVRHIEAQKALLAKLDTPQTAGQLAVAMGKSESNIHNVLKRLEGEGRVIRGGRGRDDRGRIVGALWHRTEAYDAPPDPAKACTKVKGNATRKAALAALTKPKTAAQVAEEIDRSQCHTLEILRFWEALGEVKRTKSIGAADIFERVNP